jgi:hypothetical protein
MTKHTTLIFASLPELWNFKQATCVTIVEINTGRKSLSGEFGPDEIKLAVQNFRAILSEDKTGMDKARE